jgi:two-component system sensor histidine kinase MprB
MTLNFRTRVIVAAVAAAALAIVLSSASSYITTRNALLNSADQSLLQEAGPNEPGEVQGGLFILANGVVVNGPTFFVDGTVRAFAKSNDNKRLFRTTDINGQWFRELLVPATADLEASCDNAICNAQRKGAEMFVVGFNGQINQLRHLLRTLLLVAAAVMLLALSMGLWLTRAALRPLESVTNEIEEIAREQDMSRRINEGGTDELGRLRRVFNHLLTTVDDSQALQRQLVLDASHELRTPLTSLRTNAQVLSRANELSSDDLHQLTADMVAQVDELATLITDLGELARGERSEGPVVAIRFDDVVEDCVETARTYARIKNISIDYDAEPSTVQGRRDRLTRAISNLLTNAIKFTPAGGHINVVVTPGTVQVSDSGPGIPDEERLRVFDRFWRAPSSRGLPGSGLGLSIVQQVVDEFEGTVQVDQDPQLGGARFTLSIPTSDQ